MQNGALRKKELQLLGKLVAIHRPEVAQELTAIYCQGEPYETDLSRIPELFQRFCQIKNLCPEEFVMEKYPQGRRPEKEKYPRRLFTSVILHLFKPEIFNQPLGALIIIGGMVTTLTDIMKYRSRSSVSVMIREAVQHERTYEEYRQEVTAIVERMKQREV